MDNGLTRNTRNTYKTLLLKSDEEQDKIMVDLKQIIEQNSTLKEGPKRPVGVFIGGTNGIGRATAVEFTKNTVDPTVYIVGRNASAGESLIEQLKETNGGKNAKYYFLKHDVSSIKECDKLCSVIRGQEKKLNLLFVSSGILSVSKRSETDEGIEKRMAVNYYGRWRIIDQLMPLVQKAADKKEFARVVSVLSPGHEGKLLMDDLDLKENYSFMKMYKHISTFNSLAVLRFSQVYPNVSFTHLYPGFVGGTEISRNLPSFLAHTLKFLERFAAQPLDDFGKQCLYLGASGKEYAKGSFLIDEKFKDLKQSAVQKGFLAPELQESVWKHTQQVYQSVAGK